MDKQHIFSYFYVMISEIYIGYFYSKKTTLILKFNISTNGKKCQILLEKKNMYNAFKHSNN